MLPRLISAMAMISLMFGAVTARGQAGTSGSTVTATGTYSTIDGIEVDGGRAANDLVIAWTPTNSAFTVTDRSGIRGCNQLDPQTVNCQMSGPPAAPGVVLQAREGDDSARFTGSIPGTVYAIGDTGADHFEMEAGATTRARFAGGSGDDILIAAAGRYDFLSGSRGHDHLEGGGHVDRMVGSQGRDTYIAGPGNDKINAVMNDRDREIRCGAGMDTAMVDRGLDPMPTGCERVRFNSGHFR